jgi:Rod binding domain-containing protein
VSSINFTTPPISLSEVAGKKAAAQMKDTPAAGNAKIEKSAKDFEAALMSHWLDQAEQSFATVPGGDKDQDADPGHDQFQAMAMQAVATAMSGHRGGLGIASMVAKHLEAAQAKHQEPIKALKTNDLQAIPTSVIHPGNPEVTK